MPRFRVFAFVETLITPRPMCLPSTFENFGNLHCRSLRLAVDRLSPLPLISLHSKCFAIAATLRAGKYTRCFFNVPESVPANVAVFFSGFIQSISVFLLSFQENPCLQGIRLIPKCQIKCGLIIFYSVPHCHFM